MVSLRMAPVRLSIQTNVHEETIASAAELDLGFLNPQARDAARFPSERGP